MQKAWLLHADTGKTGSLTRVRQGRLVTGLFPDSISFSGARMLRLQGRKELPYLH